MDKRFPTFLMLSALILLGYLWIQSTFFPQRPGVDKLARQIEEKDADKNLGGKQDGASKPGNTGVNQEPVLAPLEQEGIPQQWPTLGSLDADSPFRFAVTFNSRGGTIERIELNQRKASGRFRYRDQEDTGGYMGSFSPSDASDGKGCRINVVVDGTPADIVGINAGDVIVKIDDTKITSVADYAHFIKATKPGDTINVHVLRGDQPKSFQVKLSNYPLAVVRPDPKNEYDVDRQDPRSFALSVGSLEKGSFVPFADQMTTGNWQVVRPAGQADTLEFRYRLGAGEGQEEAQQEDGSSPASTPEPARALEIVKRYRLVRTPEDEQANLAHKSYHLEFEIEIINTGSEQQKVAYRLDGPTGLPTEGWWFVNKIHPTKIMGGAGARDVVWRSQDSGLKLWAGNDVFNNTLEAREAVDERDRKKEAKYTAKNTFFTSQNDQEDRALRHVGGDTQYFSVMLLPADEESMYVFHEGEARLADPSRADEANKKLSRQSNATFRLISPTFTVQPDVTKPMRQKFIVFAGPKEPDLLENYGLQDLTEYGWYGFIAKPLTKILHLFYGIVRNYGIAIIMLTVLVRACMMPISRKAARNAQMMQLLQPEMRKIADKYKNDMQKRGQVQRELFAKYNYNPFGGCLLMFLQLPIFLGLYRGLSVDIALRDQPLIPGVDWCSNLAAPDRLWYWQDAIPIPFLTGDAAGTTGFLGPYLNVLPLVTVALFLVQQKLFTPPPQDDQARMTQRMMTFMTLFIGLMFFKVPSGLCIYFITSSLWGVAERKLLPKPKLSDRVTALAEKQGGGKPTTPAKPTKTKPTKTKAGKDKSATNGAARRAKANQRRKQQRGRR